MRKIIALFAATMLGSAALAGRWNEAVRS